MDTVSASRALRFLSLANPNKLVDDLPVICLKQLFMVIGFGRKRASLFRVIHTANLLLEALQKHCHEIPIPNP